MTSCHQLPILCKHTASNVQAVTEKTEGGFGKPMIPEEVPLGSSTMHVAASLNSRFSDSSEFQDSRFEGPALSDKILCCAQENGHQYNCHAEGSLWL
ncbi:hypothetical protein NPIL_370261 [Nephila pilipes]|uniref:Uncharacterized protein n=1 Tax=Nephila pilipes TaxID=299642 RepID=A0A8X6TZ88_NEPPI|nr:hypothetical protein NPIL_370261 [Nephila pilipes]